MCVQFKKVYALNGKWNRMWAEIKSKTKNKLNAKRVPQRDRCEVSGWKTPKDIKSEL